MFKGIMSFYSELKNKHLFLFWAIIISFFFAFLPFMTGIIEFFLPYKLKCWVFLPPFFIVLLISFISVLIHRKHRFLSWIISFVLNFFVIVFVQCFFGIFIYLFLSAENTEYMFDKPQYYKETISYIYNKDKIFHFPNEIPNNAKNVEMYADVFSFFGSEEIYLAFETDKEYIDKEIKKHTYVSIEPYEKFQKRYWSTFYSIKNYKPEKFVFYVINDKEHENPQEHHFPYHYGIGVNKDYNQIIYYYFNPD